MSNLDFSFGFMFGMLATIVALLLLALYIMQQEKNKKAETLRKQQELDVLIDDLEKYIDMQVNKRTEKLRLDLISADFQWKNVAGMVKQHEELHHNVAHGILLKEKTGGESDENGGSGKNKRTIKA